MNRNSLTFLTIALLLSIGSFAQAQQNRAASAVQLPTFGYNTATTTVSVPDRGGTYMGGIKRSSSGRVESGAPLLPFKNRAIGNQTSATSFSSHVYIHDFEAMDEQILGAGKAAISNGSAAPVVVNGDRAIPFRYASTQPEPKSKQTKANQVAVRKRAKSANNDAPLVLSGVKKRSPAVLGNVKDSLEQK